MFCNDFTDKELEWLTLILKQRVCNELSIVGGRSSNFIGQCLDIRHGCNLLKFKPENISLWASKAGLPIQNSIQITLNDIFCLIYRSLSRFEEYNNDQVDDHGRFPAQASTEYQEENLDWPIVDKCIEVIRRLFLEEYPQYELEKFYPKTIVTCDVDRPYEFYTSNKGALVKKLAADLIKRKSLKKFSHSWKNYWYTNKNIYAYDPNNTFDWMMDVNEKAGNKMIFYFLVDKTVRPYDAHYSIDELRIRHLMRRIYDRGHEIGLHASYDTYKNPVQLKNEADKLRKVFESEDIKQEEIGSRQHYLRWSTPDTARCLEAAGIAYDSSLGYADRIGFRCGTSHTFPMFDI